MDESNHSIDNQNHSRMPLGMSSFGQSEREQFGTNIRLAMGCIEGLPTPVEGKAIPDDEASIRKRLKGLSQEITSQHADLLELLVRFDDLQGWKTGGASHCAAWMNHEIGISIKLSWEYLRVGRKLLLLPMLKALFRAGKLSWSKVRLITRVADEANEKILCHAALDASVSDVQRFCLCYRWNDDDDTASENDRAIKQWDSRSLTWSDASNGSTQIQLVLPPEIAQAFLNSVEHSLGQLDNSDSNDSNNSNNSTNSTNSTNNTNSTNSSDSSDKNDSNAEKDNAKKNNSTQLKTSQRRADAAVLMAERSLQAAGRAIATADRFQVMVSIDAADFVAPGTQCGSNTETETKSNIESNNNNNNNTTYTKRPTVKNAGPIARETAKRIACDCTLSVIKKFNGEPIDIGRKSRIWSAAMDRAIKERDQHCVWPGCTQSRHLQIHHLVHWMFGGGTSVINGACLCPHHHTLVHEGGLAIERVDNEGVENELFIQQHHSDDLNQCDIEKALRTDQKSFNEVRKLSPTRHRFRIVNATTGEPVSTEKPDILEVPVPTSTDTCTDTEIDNELQCTQSKFESTCVDCGEPLMESYYGNKKNAEIQSFTSEIPENYMVDTLQRKKAITNSVVIAFGTA